jgi:arylsulfatase A
MHAKTNDGPGASRALGLWAFEHFLLSCLACISPLTCPSPRRHAVPHAGSPRRYATSSHNVDFSVVRTCIHDFHAKKISRSILPSFTAFPLVGTPQSLNKSSQVPATANSDRQLFAWSAFEACVAIPGKSSFPSLGHPFERNQKPEMHLVDLPPLTRNFRPFGKNFFIFLRIRSVTAYLSKLQLTLTVFLTHRIQTKELTTKLQKTAPCKVTDNVNATALSILNSQPSTVLSPITHGFATHRTTGTLLALLVMNRFYRTWVCAILALGVIVATFPAARAAESPNIVLIFCDDLGYADIAPFQPPGAREIRTPHLDRLAREGRRFTSFYSAQPVCSASRAALLTGCYPNRVGIHGALGPKSKVGINENEMTLAELVKQKRYATAIFGKWHLGHHREFLPTRHGFDEFYGLPYSNDMWPHHPEARPGSYPDLPLIGGELTLELNPDQTKLTRDYTTRATKFIDQNKDRRFFLYLAHSMPHVPLFAGEEFQGRSRAGLYADVIEEIDWSVGQVMAELEKHSLAQNTLVIFTSDNGPWLSYGNHSGSAGELREGKGTVWEGGVRVPCIMRWPGQIPAGTTCTEPAMTIDVFPTIAALLDAELPSHKIDGKNIWPLISGTPGAKSPHEAYYFYYNTNDLLAIRSGPWKMYVPQSYRSLDGQPGGTNGVPAKYVQLKTDLALYNLEKDIGEKNNVASENPEVVKQLTALLDKMRADLGDDLQKIPPTGARAPGRIEREED